MIKKWAVRIKDSFLGGGWEDFLTALLIGFVVGFILVMLGVM